jgi:CRISPR/Cas system-associated endonuclease Cas1
MNEEAVKKRLRTAKGAALSLLRKKGCEVIYCDDHRFDLVALKKRTVKFIKICTDKIMTEDKEKVRSFAPDFKSREIKRQIWLRRRGKRKFEIQDYFLSQKNEKNSTNSSNPWV